MTLPPLQGLSKRRIRGSSFGSGVTTVFNIFSGPNELRADFIFCFVGIILFLLLFGAAITNTRKLTGRERTPAALLLVATGFFAVYYGTAFGVYENGPDVYDNWSAEALNALTAFSYQCYLTGQALMLCALLFFNNCTFELGQPSNHLIGLPSRMWAMIITGIYYLFGTMENIISATILTAEDNGASDDAIIAQIRASNALFVLERLCLLSVSGFLFYCCFVRPKGTAADKFHQTLRNVISPILILGSIVALAFSIAVLALFEILNNIFNNFDSDLSKVDGLETSQLQVTVGDRIALGLMNFVVILITLSACASIWNGKGRAIPQQPMMAGPGGYPQQQGFVPQQQQGYAQYPQQPYQQQPYQQQPYQQQPYQQQPYQQQPYQQQPYQQQQQPYQNTNTPYQTSNASSTPPPPPPPGMGYNGFNPYQQQHYPQQQQQQQQTPYGSQPGSPYQHPQASPSPPIVTDAK